MADETIQSTYTVGEKMVDIGAKGDSTRVTFLKNTAAQFIDRIEKYRATDTPEVNRLIDQAQDYIFIATLLAEKAITRVH